MISVDYDNPPLPHSRHCECDRCDAMRAQHDFDCDVFVGPDEECSCAGPEEETKPERGPLDLTRSERLMEDCYDPEPRDEDEGEAC